MDTLKIKAFLLIEKHGSFSGAAEELSYTPSALSHMADALEKELGVQLFTRTHKGVEITEAGKKLAGHFRAVTEAENALLKAVSSLVAVQDAELKIGTYSSIALHILPEILQKFKNFYPSVRISILVADRFSAWQEEEIPDVIFSDKLPDCMTEWYPMTEDAYVAVVPSDQFPKRRSVTREELYTFSYIQTNESFLNSYFDCSKFKEVIQLTSAEYGSVISMVREGIGVAVLPHLAIRERPHGVRVLQVLPKITRTLGFAFREDRKCSAAAKQFIRFLKENPMS